MRSRAAWICAGVASAGSVSVAGSPAARVATNRMTMKSTSVTNACSRRPAMYLMPHPPCESSLLETNCASDEVSTERSTIGDLRCQPRIADVARLCAKDACGLSAHSCRIAVRTVAAATRRASVARQQLDARADSVIVLPGARGGMARPQRGNGVALLEVADLKTLSAQPARRQQGRRRRQLQPRYGQEPRHRRRVRQRQIDDRAVDPAAGAAALCRDRRRLDPLRRRGPAREIRSARCARSEAAASRSSCRTR